MPMNTTLPTSTSAILNIANPYPGLRSFEIGESHLFFGREKQVDELRRKLRATRFLTVAAAIKALYATGFYSDVRLEAEGEVLIVFVQERPAIARIDIEGAKEFSKDNLKDGLKQLAEKSGLNLVVIGEFDEKVASEINLVKKLSVN